MFYVRLQIERFAMSSHTGTHLDAPAHFAKGRWAVADIPLNRLVDIPAVVIDVTEKVLADPNYEVTIEDIAQNEKNFGPLPDKSLLLIRTGWSKNWHSRDLY